MSRCIVEYDIKYEYVADTAGSTILYNHTHKKKFNEFHWTLVNKIEFIGLDIHFFFHSTERITR